MADFNVVLDPILDEMRADFQNGSGGSGGSSYVGGDRINIAGGTISFVNSADIVNVTGSSVTLQPDTAYKIYATSQAITLNANVLPAGKWAYDGHIELFVAGTGYVITGTNVVLANALEPDAVNNCTVRFHDGLAIISVEDHVAGYIVVSATGSTAGTLPYALGSASQEYVAFDATLNGQTLDMGGAVTNGEKHVVGNGYTETIVSGGINCTSNTTFANLGMNGVVVSSGTLTLGDVYIPSGSTVAVSGGGLAVERVSGNGGVIALGGSMTSIPNGGFTEGVRFTNMASATAVEVALGLSATFNGCEFVNPVSATTIAARTNATINLSNCTLNSCSLKVGNGGAFVFAGSNTFTGKFVDQASGGVILSSGAILDLTDNSNTAPVYPGSSIMFESGGATVLYSSGAVSSSYMMDNVTLPAGAKLTNTNVVDFAGATSTTTMHDTSIISGATLTGATTGYGGIAKIESGSATLNNCTITSTTATAGVYAVNTGKMYLNNCITSGNPSYALLFVQGASAEIHVSGCTMSYPGNAIARTDTGGTIYIDGGINTIGGSIVSNDSSGKVVISSGVSINLTGTIGLGVTGGIQVVGGTCTVNGVTVEPGMYTSIVSGGGSAVINQ